jgi:hypothetical protein
LYRGEKALPKTGAVSPQELATRLSYFLWSSAPDAELTTLAASGKLTQPEVLAAQTKRMLKDERIRRLATEFGCQYLHVRDIATLDEKSERHFPSFLGLREAMQEEVTRFFIDLFQNNRSVMSLLEADHTFVNAALAQHYGIGLPPETQTASPSEAPSWHRITGLSSQGRGSILGFAATLSRQSGASRTSAILRGTWLSEAILGEKLPSPPKGVPTLPEEPPVELSERQLIERHSQDPNCASCHRRIDPFGFALEGFDAIGRSRKADTRATLPDGTMIDGLNGLRSYLIQKRSEDFLRQFSRKLLGYALGRSVALSDKPLIESMTKSPGHRFADMVDCIIRSPQFTEKRGRDAVASH